MSARTCAPLGKLERELYIYVEKKFNRELFIRARARLMVPGKRNEREKKGDRRTQPSVFPDLGEGARGHVSHRGNRTRSARVCRARHSEGLSACTYARKTRLVRSPLYTSVHGTCVCMYVRRRSCIRIAPSRARAGRIPVISMSPLFAGRDD